MDRKKYLQRGNNKNKKVRTGRAIDIPEADMRRIKMVSGLMMLMEGITGKPVTAILDDAEKINDDDPQVFAGVYEKKMDIVPGFVETIQLTKDHIQNRDIIVPADGVVYQDDVYYYFTPDFTNEQYAVQKINCYLAGKDLHNINPVQ